MVQSGSPVLGLRPRPPYSTPKCRISYNPVVLASPRDERYACHTIKNFGGFMKRLFLYGLMAVLSIGMGSGNKLAAKQVTPFGLKGDVLGETLEEFRAHNDR